MKKRVPKQAPSSGQASTGGQTAVSGQTSSTCSNQITVSDGKPAVNRHAPPNKHISVTPTNELKLSGRKTLAASRPASPSVSAPPLASTCIVINNLHSSADEGTIHSILTGLKGILYKRCQIDPDKNKAIVELCNDADANKALSTLNGITFLGQEVHVSLAPCGSRNELQPVVPAVFTSDKSLLHMSYSNDDKMQKAQDPVSPGMKI